MTGLFELGWPDVVIAIDQIESIGPEVKQSNGEKYRELRMRKGDPRRVHPREVERLLNRAVQLLPAQGGLSVLRVWDNGGKGELIRAPVIAWALCLDGDVRAVTPQGINDSNDRDADIYVEMSDGSVQSVGEFCDIVCYDDANDYLRDMSKRLLPREPDATP